MGIVYTVYLLSIFKIRSNFLKMLVIFFAVFLVPFLVMGLLLPIVSCVAILLVLIIFIFQSLVEKYKAFRSGHRKESDGQTNPDVENCSQAHFVSTNETNVSIDGKLTDDCDKNNRHSIQEKSQDSKRHVKSIGRILYSPRKEKGCKITKMSVLKDSKPQTHNESIKALGAIILHDMEDKNKHQNQFDCVHFNYDNSEFTS